MKVAILGTGYVGLVTGCGLAKLGHEVTCLDLDEHKIAMLNAGATPFFEPDLPELLGDQVATGRLKFSSQVGANLGDKDIVFIAVGTPPLPDGDSDLSFVFSATKMIGQYCDQDTLVVTKSTVPVGTNRQMQELLSAKAMEKNIRVSSNPEFLREGSAVRDFFKPDRVVVGVQNEKSLDQLKALYAGLNLNDWQSDFIVGTWESAELVKYAANSFLATKVAFINELADISERVGANIDVVAAGMGSDARIGHAFLKSGPGYGGSCFPKDMLALVATAQRVGLPAQIAQSTIAANDGRMRMWADRIATLMGQPIENLRIGQLGLSFKAHTDDVRASPAIALARSFLARSAFLTAYDPHASENAQQALPQLQISQNMIGCAKDADALVIATEWPDFSGIDLIELRNTMRGNWIFDLRGVLDTKAVTGAGFFHYRVGHKLAQPAQ